MGNDFRFKRFYSYVTWWVWCINDINFTFYSGHSEEDMKWHKLFWVSPSTNHLAPCTCVWEVQSSNWGCHLGRTFISNHLEGRLNWNSLHSSLLWDSLCLLCSLPGIYQVSINCLHFQTLSNLWDKGKDCHSLNWKWSGAVSIHHVCSCNQNF